MKRLVSLVVCLVFGLLCVADIACAQFQNVSIGVNGLTCSQCTRTVEMSIRKLDFVADVDMNLQHTEGKITLKKNSKPDMDKIAQAVINAGFSVRYLDAELVNVGLDADYVDKDNQCFVLYGDQYVFTETPKEPLKGLVKLKFIGKKYMPKKEYSKIAPKAAGGCGKTGGRVFYVSQVAG